MTSAAADVPDAVPSLAVVVPARNEEQRLPRCLDALVAADLAVRHTVPSASPTRIVVVLDSCTDDSRSVVERYPGVELVICTVGNVGAARAAGVDHLLSAGPAAPQWIACTDADSAVPAGWLVDHLRHACADTDLLLGLVRPDADELQPSSFNRWMSQYHLRDGHPHIHGANMGVRTTMYRRAGGFLPLAEHEDVALTHSIRALSGRVVSVSANPVLTSARVDGRTPGGMAGYLRALTPLAVVVD